MRKLVIAALLSMLAVTRPAIIDGSEPIRMQVSPAVSRAPAFLTVRVFVDSRTDYRMLQVSAESSDFYRSSQIPIDGRNASSLKVFEFANLPTGTYEVTGVLIGVDGPRATVSRVARVVSSPGSR
jgi:hypothetical protein